MTDPRAAAIAALERALAAEDLDQKATPGTAGIIAEEYGLDPRSDVPIIRAELTLARETWRNGVPIEPCLGTVIRNALLNLKRSE